jgi:unsaturated rhamnogalacturonyl hydrolase
MKIKKLFILTIVFIMIGAKFSMAKNLPNKRDLKNKKLLVETNINDSTFAHNKFVGLDYFYNDEWKKSSSGEMVQYHYIWEDTANSGYSDAGKIITSLGAKLGELHIAPTFKQLKNFSIYIIVDPDTPQETKHPHYIEKDAVKEIVKWVKSGGVLMLLGNDKGNSEFKHFNTLAEKFGIHFNEDSRNDVQGKNYYQGKFDHLPVHPLFKDVDEIYMKGISTFRLKKPAEAILTDRGDVIMAYSQYGKGTVFAVGDPWFYNEYIYNKYLPSEYENGEAAKNLFIWLLKKAKTVKK